MTRTPEETIARIEAIQAGGQVADFFGKRREILALSLPFEHVKPYLTEEAVAEGPGAWSSLSPAEEAATYLPFAIGKMQGERGLSAQRSVDAYQELIWLLTDDETTAEYEALDYHSYGRPQLEFAATKLGLTEQWTELTK